MATVLSSPLPLATPEAQSSAVADPTPRRMLVLMVDVGCEDIATTRAKLRTFATGITMAPDSALWCDYFDLPEPVGEKVRRLLTAISDGVR